MEDVQRQLDQERDHAAAGPSPTGNEYSRLNPLYQELPSQLSQAQRDIAATRSRMGAAESMLEAEMARRRGLPASDGAPPEPTHVYDRPAENYQDLSARPENVRAPRGHGT